MWTTRGWTIQTCDREPVFSTVSPWPHTGISGGGHEVESQLLYPPPFYS